MVTGRRGTGWICASLSLIVWLACETTRNPGGIQRDLTPPVIQLGNTAGDTQDISGGLRYTIQAVDNLALRTIRVTYSGGFIAIQDTNFTGQVTNVQISRNVSFPGGSGAGGLIRLVGRATDGAGNFDEDTIFIFLANVQALQVVLLAPLPGAVASSGRNIPVTVQGVQNSGISKIGFLVSPTTAVSNPTTPPNDSLIFSIPFADSVVYNDTLTVVATTGSFNIVGFAEDSAGRRGTSNVVTVNIQSAANDVTPPSVTHIVGARVEVADSVIVHATDASSVAWMGIRITNLAGGLLRFDTVAVGGNLTDVQRSFGLNLAAIITSFPTDVVVQGYACDGAVARNCAFSTINGIVNGTLDVDSVTVVAGVTKPLPAGGRIADAIFNANQNELYLTNPSLSRVEIFQVANTTFVATGIPTAGPAPWGIALWPRDTLGNYADTIVVANSGGTQMSVIDVSPGVRRLRWRQDLPNYLIQTYKVLNVGGVFFSEVETFDVSDRPQYVGTVCRPPSGGTACHVDSVYAFYSTTPTQSSTSPFEGRATLRLEKLTPSTNPLNLFSHLYWELAAQSSGITTDTLRIVMRRGLPYNQTQVQLTACAGVTIDLNVFGLGDTTYVRNSGNFTHAFAGEGGNISIAFARVMSYSAKQAITGVGAPVSCFTSIAGAAGPSDAGEDHRDLGMSPAVDVSDFISNTGVNIQSIATNFNGGTNLVRADSIYVLDEGLRLKGTSPAPTGAPGMDMNYDHAFLANEPGTPTFPPGTGNPNDRIVFAARPDGNIDAFDTFFYGVVGSIPVRDPIIGPLRVAKDLSGNQLLFGITARGLVTVRLPTITNPNPVSRHE